MTETAEQLDTPAARTLIVAKRSIAITRGMPQKLAALKAGAASLAMPVRHGFISREHVTDELFEQADNCGLLEDVGETVVGAAIQAGLATFEANGNDTAAPLSYEHDEQPAPDQARFGPIAIDDVQPSAEPAWLVHRIIPARGLACIVGPPKCGKSFFLTDMLFAVARGVDYAGRPTTPGPVMYLTGEGVTGFKRRLVAMRRHYGAEGRGVPFFMIPSVPDLGSERTDVRDLLRELDRFIFDHGLPPPRAVALDTLARCMGEGDENSAKDMGRFVNRAAIIEQHFSCVVPTVHHKGKNPAAGGRGSNALNGAADVTIEVEKSATVHTVKIDEMKDGPEGQSWRFRLIPFDLGETSGTHAETGSETTSCVVEIIGQVNYATRAETKAVKPPAGLAGHLLKVIRRAIDEEGQINAAGAAVPTNVRAVTRQTIKTHCAAMDWQDQDGNPDGFRSMLSKTLSALAARDSIAMANGWVWLQ